MKRLSIGITFALALSILVFPEATRAFAADANVDESMSYLSNLVIAQAPSDKAQSFNSYAMSPKTSDVNHEPFSQSLKSSSTANDELFQEKTLYAQGESGSCKWVIYSDAEMVIAPAQGSEGTLGSWISTSGPSWNSAREFVKTVRFEGTVYVQSCYRMFFNWKNLTSVDFTNLNTSNVETMNGMFLYCEKLTSIDVSSLDTSRVTNMDSMFHGCRALGSINFGNFNTSRVTNMFRMFYTCLALQSLDLRSFDTSHVTNMKQMFGYCSSLKSLDVGSFNTSSVNEMDGMFSNCKSLISLDLSHFNTSRLTRFSNLFAGCSSLRSLDISHFDASQVTSMENMFYHCSSLEFLNIMSFYTFKLKETPLMFGGCTKLKRIYDAGNFLGLYINSSRNMFLNCANLTGLFGTKCSVNNVDYYYGRPDSIDKPGYFTKPCSLDGVNLVLAHTELTYNGTIQYPTISKTGDYHLFPDAEYSLVVAKGEPKEAGTYKVAIEGKGYFSGRSEEVEFYIRKATPHYTLPENLTGYAGLSLSTIALPDGWTWDNPKAVLSDAPGTYDFSATFTPADERNYESAKGISVPVSVLPKTDIHDGNLPTDTETA